MGWKFPKLNSCCFCVPLKFGALLCGYFLLLLQIIGGGLTLYRISLQKFDNHVTAVRAYMLYTLQITGMLVYLVLSVLLILGIHKNKPKYLRQFFTAGLVTFIMNSVVIFVGIVFFFGWEVVQWFTIYFLFNVLHFYLLLVVRSAYLQMEQEDARKHYEDDL